MKNFANFILLTWISTACGAEGFTVSGDEDPEDQIAQAGSGIFDGSSGLTEGRSASVRIRQVNTNRERGFLTVPLDENDDNGETIELAFVRITERESAPPILVHFGGPGSSAVQRLPDYVGNLPRDFRKRYTFIGLDEIGVNASPLLRCSDVSVSGVLAHPFIQAPSDELEQFGEDVADSCADSPLFDQAGTARYARDIDRLREALGYERLNILGYSYGTDVAIHYAALFPDRVGRVVLDSPTDIRVSFQDITRFQSQASGEAFDEFISWCESRNNCSVDIDEVNLLIDFLAGSLDPDIIFFARQLGSGISRFLNFEPAWPMLAAGLEELTGSPEAMNRLLGRETEDFGFDAFVATSCTDLPIARTQQIFNTMDVFERRYTSELSLNFFANNFDSAFPCAFWNAEADLVRWDSVLPRLENADSILIISALGDNQNPRVFTNNLVRTVPDLRVVTVDEVSHAISLTGLNPCLDNAVTEFFNKGTVSTTECKKSFFAPADATAMASRDFFETFLSAGSTKPLPWEMFSNNRPGR